MESYHQRKTQRILKPHLEYGYRGTFQLRTYSIPSSTHPKHRFQLLSPRTPRAEVPERRAGMGMGGREGREGASFFPFLLNQLCTYGLPYLIRLPRGTHAPDNSLAYSKRDRQPLTSLSQPRSLGWRRKAWRPGHAGEKRVRRAAPGGGGGGSLSVLLVAATAAAEPPPGAANTSSYCRAAADRRRRETRRTAAGANSYLPSWMR